MSGLVGMSLLKIAPCLELCRLLEKWQNGDTLSGREIRGIKASLQVAKRIILYHMKD